jgi:PST family polysaccharide transporter
MQSIYSTAGVLYNTQGRTDLQFRWMMFASVWYVLSFILGLRWGIMGVAACYAVVWTLLMVPGILIPFRLVELSGWKFLRTLWPTVWIGLVMTAICGAWRYLLYRLGATNPYFDLLSTVSVGVAVYVGLILRRRPRVLAELKTVLQGTSYRAAQWLGRRLPGPVTELDPTRELELPATEPH